MLIRVLKQFLFITHFQIDNISVYGYCSVKGTHLSYTIERHRRQSELQYAKNYLKSTSVPSIILQAVCMDTILAVTNKILVTTIFC